LHFASSTVINPIFDLPVLKKNKGLSRALKIPGAVFRTPHPRPLNVLSMLMCSQLSLKAKLSALLFASAEALDIMRSLLFAQPVLAHELMRPTWLPNLLAREELNHDRLNIEHRRSIDCIEFGDEKLATFYPNNATNGAADSIGAILASLSEDANGWPGHIVPWVACTRDNFRRLDLVKDEQDLNVRELREALQGVGRELFGEYDARFLSTPEVVFGVRSNSLDVPDCLDLHVHCTASISHAKRWESDARFTASLELLGSPPFSLSSQRKTRHDFHELFRQDRGHKAGTRAHGN
jgi:hypothetical protein